MARNSRSDRDGDQTTLDDHRIAADGGEVTNKHTESTTGLRSTWRDRTKKIINAMLPHEITLNDTDGEIVDVVLNTSRIYEAFAIVNFPENASLHNRRSLDKYGFEPEFYGYQPITDNQGNVVGIETEFAGTYQDASTVRNGLLGIKVQFQTGRTQ